MKKAIKAKVFSSIRFKLFLYLLLIAVLFLLAFFIPTAGIQRNFLRQDAEDITRSLLVEINERINGTFSYLEDLSNFLGHLQAIRSVDREGMKDVFLALIQADPDFPYAYYFATPDGRYFEYGYEDDFIDNEIILPENYNPTVRDWYKQAVKNGRFTISEPYRYALVPELGVTAATPIFSEEENLIGVLGIDMLLSDIRKMLEDLNIQKGGKALLVSAQGQIIASQFEDPMESVILKEVFTRGSSATNASLTELLGTDYYVSSMRNEYTGWTFCIALPYQEIIRDARSNLNKMLFLFCFIVIALVLANLLLVSRAILQPLKNMTGVITRLKSGEKQIRAPIHSRDEYGIMAAEFNHLIDIVEGHLEALEERINHRTARLITLEQENTRLRIIEEKERISRDLHDTIGAKLTNIRICNNIGRALIPDNSEPGRMQRLIEENCSGAIRELRLIVSDLDSDPEEDTDLHHFLETLLPHILELRMIEFEAALDWNEIESLTPAVKTETRKILEELFNNIMTHSKARHSSLRIEGSPEFVTLTITDDGVGFDPGAENEGHGLKSLSKRVCDLKGSLSIESQADDAGAKICITIPKRQENSIAE